MSQRRQSPQSHLESTSQPRGTKEEEETERERERQRKKEREREKAVGRRRSKRKRMEEGRIESQQFKGCDGVKEGKNGQNRIQEREINQ